MTKKIAFEGRLRDCRNVMTLGVRTNFFDYTPNEIELIRNAEKIYYPTTFYADLFDSIGKKTFPSYHTYKCVQDKIKQTALFNLNNISHPKTKIFYAKRQKDKILDYFKFPFIAKIPRGSSMGNGVFLLNNKDELFAYCNQTKIAYIQEYLPIDRDIRIIIIGDKVVCAYWRISQNICEFRNNIAKGAFISFDTIPKDAIELAVYTAKKCNWDDVGLDICVYKGNYYVIEANMKYGKQGIKMAGINYITLMEKLIEDGVI